MRILISGGGTAGHVYPNIAVVQAMTDAANSGLSARVELLYLGESASVEETLARQFGIPFMAISMGGLRGKVPWTMVWNGAKLMVGLVQAYSAIGRFDPNIILVSGGYGSVPSVAAGRLRNVPVLVYLPDIVPGLAIRQLSRWVTRIAVSFSETTSFFARSKSVVTGYPVRREFHEVSKAAARLALSLDADGPVVMVFGGSRGAHSINVTLAQILPDLLRASQVIHVSGPGDHNEAQRNRELLPSDLRARYHLYSYLHEGMVQALASADLVVARAGASVLGEFPALGLPSILVPYPYSGQHQEANADFMVGHGAAIKIADDRLGQALLASIFDLLRHPDRLSTMGRAAAAMNRPEAARQIVSELWTMAAHRHGWNRDDVP